MEKRIIDVRLGDKLPVYRENFWTGRKSIFIDGTECEKVSRNVYLYRKEGEEPQEIRVRGNSLSGVKLFIGADTFVVIEAPAWYEWILAFLGFAFVLIWGNVPLLCAIFPVVGGAIGGLVSGGLAMISLVCIRRVQAPLLKIVIGFAFFAATVLICWLIGVALVVAVVSALAAV